MTSHKVTLKEILDHREYRQTLIYNTQSRYPDHSILSFKLNIPGAIKNTENYQFVYLEGLKHLNDLSLIYDFQDCICGPEAILISDKNSKELKREMIALEDHHPLGRLFDLDVLNVDRKALNLLPRLCLVCEKPAHECSRSQSHKLEDVLDKIEDIITQFKNTSH